MHVQNLPQSHRSDRVSLAHVDSRRVALSRGVDDTKRGLQDAYRREYRVDLNVKHAIRIEKLSIGKRNAHASKRYARQTALLS